MSSDEVEPVGSDVEVRLCGCLTRSWDSSPLSFPARLPSFLAVTNMATGPHRPQLPTSTRRAPQEVGCWPMCGASTRQTVDVTLQPDPAAEWWTTSDVAAYLGVRVATVSTYRKREQMPAPDLTLGRTPAWRPARIVEWHASRPRPGVGGRPVPSADETPTE
jgi:hypothetical protein